MRKILIIGATSAIAQETAKLFAQQQDTLFLIGRDVTRLEIIAADLKVRGAPQVDYLSADLTDYAQHENLIKQVYARLGTVDIVLIAYGTLDDQRACQQDFNKAKQALDTNFISVVSLLTDLANRFEQQHYGCIAVISSVAGDRGRQSNYIYGAAKGGLTIFLQGLRNRLHHSHVCVLTIKPGFVDSPMTAQFKKGLLWAQPETIAKGIDRAIKNRNNIVYLPWFWQGIMGIIRCVPEFIFKRLKL